MPACGCVVFVVGAEAEGEGGVGPRAEELMDAQSDAAASSLATGLSSIYTQNTHAPSGARPPSAWAPPTPNAMCPRASDGWSQGSLIW